MLIRPAFWSALLPHFPQCLGVIVPKLFPTRIQTLQPTPAPSKRTPISRARLRCGSSRRCRRAPRGTQAPNIDRHACGWEAVRDGVDNETGWSLPAALRGAMLNASVNRQPTRQTHALPYSILSQVDAFSGWLRAAFPEPTSSETRSPVPVYANTCRPIPTIAPSTPRPAR